MRTCKNAEKRSLLSEDTVAIEMTAISSDPLFCPKQTFGRLQDYDIIQEVRLFLSDKDLLNYNRVSSLFACTWSDTEEGRAIWIPHPITINQFSLHRQLKIYEQLQKKYGSDNFYLPVVLNNWVKQLFYDSYHYNPFFEVDLKQAEKLVSHIPGYQSIKWVNGEQPAQSAPDTTTNQTNLTSKELDEILLYAGKKGREITELIPTKKWPRLFYNPFFIKLIFNWECVLPVVFCAASFTFVWFFSQSLKPEDSVDLYIDIIQVDKWIDKSIVHTVMCRDAVNNATVSHRGNFAEAMRWVGFADNMTEAVLMTCRTWAATCLYSLFNENGVNKREVSDHLLVKCDYSWQVLNDLAEKSGRLAMCISLIVFVVVGLFIIYLNGVCSGYRKMKTSRGVCLDEKTASKITRLHCDFFSNVEKAAYKYKEDQASGLRPA